MKRLAFLLALSVFLIPLASSAGFNSKPAYCQVTLTPKPKLNLNLNNQKPEPNARSPGPVTKYCYIGGSPGPASGTSCNCEGGTGVVINPSSPTCASNPALCAGGNGGAVCGTDPITGATTCH